MPFRVRYLVSGGWRLLSLLPDVDPSTTENSTPGALNFPTGEQLDWTGGRSDEGGWTSSTVTPAPNYELEVNVDIADPIRNPAPIFLLTDRCYILVGPEDLGLGEWPDRSNTHRQRNVRSPRSSVLFDRTRPQNDGLDTK